MVERISAGKEDASQLLVVIGHHRGPRCFLRQGEQVMDILDRAESLLPQLELDRRIELSKSRVKVSLQGVGIRQIDRELLIRLIGIFRHIRKMKTQRLA